MDAMTEKQLFIFGCFIPPLVILALLGSLVRFDPRPLLSAVGPLIPGYKSHTYYEDSATLRLRLSANADFFADHFQNIRRHSILRRFSTAFSGEPAAEETTAASGQGTHDSQRVLELWINLHHLLGTSLLPTLFLIMYFWDQAVIHKEGGREFPLSSCMEDYTYCFWNNRSYSVLNYPDYNKLDCAEMMDRTVNASSLGFAFHAPPTGAFYKCYTMKLSFEDIIGALGDVACLTALGLIVILRYSINFTTFKTDQKGAREHAEAIRRAKWTNWCWIIVCLVCVGPSCYAVQWLCGDFDTSFVTYLFLPGSCGFFIILLCQRLEIIQKQEQEAAEDRGSSDSDSSTDGEDSSTGYLLSVEEGGGRGGSPRQERRRRSVAMESGRGSRRRPWDPRLGTRPRSVISAAGHPNYQEVVELEL